MNQKRKGTKSAKEGFFAFFASLRFYRYHLTFSPRLRFPCVPQVLRMRIRIPEGAPTDLRADLRRAANRCGFGPLRIRASALPSVPVPLPPTPVPGIQPLNTRAPWPPIQTKNWFQVIHPPLFDRQNPGFPRRDSAVFGALFHKTRVE
jgi:hypothetical protein